MTNSYEEWREKQKQAWLKNPEGLYDAYKDLLLELIFPPEPWSVFGEHIDAAEGSLIFWGSGDDGLPLWERLKDEND